MDSRVLHIDSGAEWRGGQRQLFLLALEQRARGTEPLVVSQPRSRLVIRLRSSGIASSGVRMRGRWDLNAVRRIRRLIRMWHPQIVHAHDTRAYALARKALVGIQSVGLVVTCRTIPRRASSMGRTGQRYARFIAPNGEISSFLTGIGINAGNIDTIPPGVPVHRDLRPRDWRRECRWPGSAIVCGVIGVSTRGGGVSSQVRQILSKLSSEVRSRIRVVLLGGAGSGETVLAGTAAFSAGFVDDIAPAIAGFDLLLNISGTESMGTAVLDGMAMGVPPVVWEGGGGGDYVEHGQSGLVIPSGDTVAFAAALSSLVEDEELRDTLAAFGPGRAAGFSVARMTEATELVYGKALLKRQGNDAGSLTA